jgi:RNA-directed DNA polymerase
MVMSDTIVQRISSAVGVPTWTIVAAARKAPIKYKVYQIPKRSGTGMRTIAQPAKDTKVLQRWLVEHELSLLPVHGCTTAYRSGASIRENAQRHINSRYLFKADFSNFFASITDAHLEQHLRKYLPTRYSGEELRFISHVVLWRPNLASRRLELCIGAPSSPCISNTIMYDFDVQVSNYCDELGIVYSRYADDLTFSTTIPGLLTGVPNVLRNLLGALEYPRIRLNEDKSVFTSKKYRRTVTGLVLSSQGAVSLGRDRKRLIRAMVDHFRSGILDSAGVNNLRGLIAFAHDVEPEFVNRLAKRYGPEVIENIRRPQII